MLACAGEGLPEPLALITVNANLQDKLVLGKGLCCTQSSIDNLEVADKPRQNQGLRRGRSQVSFPAARRYDKFATSWSKYTPPES